MAQSKLFGAFAGMAAAGAVAAAPASAAQLPTAAAPIALTSNAFESDPAFDIFSPAVEVAEHHRYRRYRGYRRHRGRVRTGDVVAGVLILGGIAAIANAASKNKRDRRGRDYDYRDRDRNYRDNDRRDNDRRDNRRGDGRFGGGSGIDNAVSQCVNQIERDVRVEGVDSVDRSGEGWTVQGSLYNGDRFTCRIGNDGRVSDVNFGGGFTGASADAVEDRQWTDDRYANARRARGTGSTDVAYQAQPVRAEPEASAQPAYPGGPLPGEAVDEDLGG